MPFPSEAPRDAYIKTLLRTHLLENTKVFERFGDESAAEVSDDGDHLARDLSCVDLFVWLPSPGPTLNR